MKKKCFFCGTQWEGFRGQPRSRERCQVCGHFLHCCVNCHHFDQTLGSVCRLAHTAYVGDREILNYCEDYQMLDSGRRASEDRVLRAKTAWDELFRK